MTKRITRAPKKKGRPSAYKVEYDEQVYKLCLLGATDEELANFFEVKKQTINNWKTDYPSFFDSLKRGKLEADSNVAQSLYHRALGYDHPEDVIFNDKGTPLIVPTIKHYPPDATSAIFWLKNRQPTVWRDKKEFEKEKIEIERERVNIEKQKLKTSESLLEAVKTHNLQVNTLAEMLNNPKPDRNPEDFEEEQ